MIHRRMPRGFDLVDALILLLLCALAPLLWHHVGVATVVLIASAVAFGCYGHDKQRARIGGRRVREATLQLLALAGGWPGAWLGQRLFRHKTAKTRFRLVFVLAALLNLLTLWYWSVGAAQGLR
ncbi:DUF1294 domain-containing protein [Jeongeupia wiesaeckerbachi]|uniref:DUF1294 domain-containing protein n=1 Tax=Jeongeupia wiesaeckerbachi TaxID=3051218 RepID=UPI003D800791